MGFQDNKFLREQSDAFGSIAYSNTTGITYATIGAGEITVRDATAGFSLDALNRDPDNMQVITSQTSFAIEIPGHQPETLGQPGEGQRQPDQGSDGAGAG